MRKTNKLFFKASVFGVEVVSQNKSHLSKIKKSLELIRDIDKLLFKKVLRLKAILIYPGKTEYGSVYEKERIYVDQPKSFSQTSLAWIASGIIHEAWHIDQYKRGIRKYGVRKERGTYLVQRRFLKKAGGLKKDIKWLDKVYRLQWWEPKSTHLIGYDEKSVEKTTDGFWEFLKKYKQGKLKIKEIKV